MTIRTTTMAAALVAAMAMSAATTARAQDEQPPKPAPGMVAEAPVDQAVVELGREASEQFWEGDLAALWERMTPDMQAALGSEEALASFRDKARTDLGEQTGPATEQTPTVPGYRVYQHIADYENVPLPVVTQWTFNAEDTQIAGFFIRPNQ